MIFTELRAPLEGHLPVQLQWTEHMCERESGRWEGPLLISRVGMLMHYQTNHTKDFLLVHWPIEPDDNFLAMCVFILLHI